MQDFTHYNYDITIEQLKRAFEVVKDISVIINGEYYTLIEEPSEKRAERHRLIYNEVER